MQLTKFGKLMYQYLLGNDYRHTERVYLTGGNNSYNGTIGDHYLYGYPTNYATNRSLVLGTGVLYRQDVNEPYYLSDAITKNLTSGAVNIDDNKEIITVTMTNNSDSTKTYTHYGFQSYYNNGSSYVMTAFDELPNPITIEAGASKVITISLDNSNITYFTGNGRKLFKYMFQFDSPTSNKTFVGVNDSNYTYTPTDLGCNLFYNYKGSVGIKIGTGTNTSEKGLYDISDEIFLSTSTTNYYSVDQNKLRVTGAFTNPYGVDKVYTCYALNHYNGTMWFLLTYAEFPEPIELKAGETKVITLEFDISQI